MFDSLNWKEEKIKIFLWLSIYQMETGKMLYLIFSDGKDVRLD